MFGKLNSDIFTVFSGTNRSIYETIIETIYERFYQSEIFFPSQNDVILLIYDQLAEKSHLWRDDEVPIVLDQLSSGKGRRIRRRRNGTADPIASTDAMMRARHIYYRLIATGWLEPIQYGLKITVDMPPGAMRLAEFLCGLKAGVSEQLGGLLVQIKTNLDHLELKARENALGLHKAARDAASFGRYMRSVLSALREIDKQVVELQPHLMNADILAQYGIPATTNTPLSPHGGDDSAIADLWNALRQTGLALEQESLSPRLP